MSIGKRGPPLVTADSGGQQPCGVADHHLARQLWDRPQHQWRCPQHHWDPILCTCNTPSKCVEWVPAQDQVADILCIHGLGALKRHRHHYWWVKRKVFLFINYLACHRTQDWCRLQIHEIQLESKCDLPVFQALARLHRLFGFRTRVSVIICFP